MRRSDAYLGETFECKSEHRWERDGVLGDTTALSRFIRAALRQSLGEERSDASLRGIVEDG